jgi:hypothetical protein
VQELRALEVVGYGVLVIQSSATRKATEIATGLASGFIFSFE